jgi:hypothetical protein
MADNKEPLLGNPPPAKPEEKPDNAKLGVIFMVI